MTEESAPAEAAEPLVPPSSPTPVSARRGLPRWVPYFLLAVMPAVLVGLIVFAIAGGGGGSSSVDRAAGVIDGFLRLGPSSDSENINSFKAKLPTGFPTDFPMYANADLIASFVINADDGKNYFVILSTADSPDKIYGYYLAGLDKDPWQVEVGRASSDFTAVRFSRPANADLEGDVTVRKSELDGKTAIYVSLQDSSATSKSTTPSKPFALPASRSLPGGFPTDIPIYKGDKSGSIVTDTYFQRSGSGQKFFVSFLTKNTQADVMGFYRDEFQKRGWTLTDTKAPAKGFALSLDFSDGSKQQVSGTVSADAFESDASYTKVDLLLQVAPNRGKGN